MLSLRKFGLLSFLLLLGCRAFVHVHAHGLQEDGRADKETSLQELKALFLLTRKMYDDQFNQESDEDHVIGNRKTEYENDVISEDLRKIAKLIRKYGEKRDNRKRGWWFVPKSDPHADDWRKHGQVPTECVACDINKVDGF